MTCSCHRCTQELVESEPFVPDPELGILGMIDARLARMFLCEWCGNKRCPHATDHRNTCTWSNDPGQKGSLYEDAPGPPRWQSFGLQQGEIQIMPIGDLREHERSSGCWCRPSRDEEDSRIVVHNAMDRREEYERGERRPA